MGTPEFAVPSLKALIDNQWEVQMVVTQPDRPAGRGQQMQAPPVKNLALEHGIPVLQLSSFRKEPEALQKLKSVECDFLVVAAFGQILPDEVLSHPKIAPLNVHASLLPAYRGAAPIARAIMEGEVRSGVTIQWMIEALDQGDILYQIPCDLKESDTAVELHDRLKTIGAQALLECLARFERDQIHRIPQDPRIGSYARKLTKEEARISFDAPAYNVHRKIMGLNPWPVAECQLAGQRLKVYRSRFEPRPSEADPGTVVDITDDALVIACRDGCVSLLEIQMENRKRLPVREFLQGYPIRKGLILGGSST